MDSDGEVPGFHRHTGIIRRWPRRRQGPNCLLGGMKSRQRLQPERTPQRIHHRALSHQSGQLPRHGGTKAQPPTRAGMLQVQLGGMQGQTSDRIGSRLVFEITDDREPRLREMHPNLVPAPGLEAKPGQRSRSAHPEHTIMQVQSERDYLVGAIHVLSAIAVFRDWCGLKNFCNI